VEHRRVALISESHNAVLGSKENQMNTVTWKSYKTETAAIRYANKIAKEHNIILSVTFVCGLYLVGA